MAQGSLCPDKVIPRCARKTWSAAGYCFLTVALGQAELCCTPGAACAGVTVGFSTCCSWAPKCWS